MKGSGEKELWLVPAIGHIKPMKWKKLNLNKEWMNFYQKYLDREAENM